MIVIMTILIVFNTVVKESSVVY